MSGLSRNCIQSILSVFHPYRDENTIVNFCHTCRSVRECGQKHIAHYKAHRLFLMSAEHDQLDFCKYFVEKHGVSDFEALVPIGQEKCNRKMVDYALDMGAKDFNGMLRRASLSKSKEYINLAVFNGATNYSEALMILLEKNDFPLFNYVWDWNVFMRSGKDGFLDINEYLRQAAQRDMNNFCLWLIGIGANNFKELIFVAACHRNEELFDLALERGWDPEGKMRYGIDARDLTKDILYHAVLHDNKHMIDRIQQKISKVT